MNEDLEDVILGGDEADLSDVAVDLTGAANDAVADTPTTTSVPDSPVVDGRKRAGRKVDTTGKTALGSARILYSQNSGLDTKALKALFLEKLGPVFGTDSGTAQTYVSLVRKKVSKAA